MEKSSTSPVANVISNGDKRSCSHTLGEREKREKIPRSEIAKARASMYVILLDVAKFSSVSRCSLHSHLAV